MNEVEAVLTKDIQVKLENNTLAILLQPLHKMIAVCFTISTIYGAVVSLYRKKRGKT